MKSDEITQRLTVKLTTSSRRLKSGLKIEVTVDSSVYSGDSDQIIPEAYHSTSSSDSESPFTEDQIIPEAYHSTSSFDSHAVVTQDTHNHVKGE